MFIIKHSKKFFAISAILVLISLVAIFTKGFNVGIDFTGGSAFEIKYLENRPDVSVVKQVLNESGVEIASVRPYGEDSFLFQLKSTDSETPNNILTSLSQASPELKLEMSDPHIIGSSIGAELRSKAVVAIIMVSLGIILYIAYAFRSSSEKVSSFKFGSIAVLALIHDVTIATGVVVLLGIEVNSLFVVAILSILGISVNDTIVVFDRIRENLKLRISKDFGETVGKSLDQTFVRSLNTSLTTIFVITCLYFFGPESTKDFAFVLAAGLIVGTYSSLFLASPLLVTVENREQAKNQTKSKKK